MCTVYKLNIAYKSWQQKHSGEHVFLNKIIFFSFSWYTTLENLSIHVSSTNVGLILTKLRWFQLFITSKNTSHNSISTILERDSNFCMGFHTVVLVKSFPLMSFQLLLLYNWYWRSYCEFQHKSKFNFDLFWKEIQIFGFTCWSTREDLSIDASITNMGLILIDEARVISFLGVRADGRIYIHDFGILIWKHVGTQKISSQSSKLRVSCRSLYASPDDRNA